MDAGIEGLFDILRFARFGMVTGHFVPRPPNSQLARDLELCCTISLAVCEFSVSVIVNLRRDTV